MVLNKNNNLIFILFIYIILCPFPSYAVPPDPSTIDDSIYEHHRMSKVTDNGYFLDLEIYSDPNGSKFLFDPTTQEFYDINDFSELSGEIEKRVTALESSKQDLSMWITIFVTSVILVIGINIGLSVWQVGSIAQREAEDYMKEYEKSFQHLINDTISQIDDKITNYKDKLDELEKKVYELSPQFESDIERSEDAIKNLASSAEKILKEFKDETQEIKLNVMDEIEKWLEKNKNDS